MKTLSLISVLLTFSVAGLAAETAADRLRSGDEYFAQFDDAKSLAEYESAARLEPENFEALWKTGRAYMNVGDQVPHSDEDHEQVRLRYFKTAEDYLRRAIRIEADDSRTHFLLSAVLGREVRSLGRREQIQAAKVIKAEIDKALALDPSNDLAWHALAYWNRTLAEVGGAVRFVGSILYGSIPKGSYEEAVTAFQKAISLNPSYCNHHFELARTYLDLKEKDLAIKEFQAGLDCPDQTSMCSRFKRWARRHLDEVKSSA